ncbi:hypothetical protein SpCBS45565_g06999 [Spizellomyces sp. 'palustris']|nr:hypothetical protein SpCBS45565_g06999 [Spizellomyces sp. 'palustris']
MPSSKNNGAGEMGNRFGRPDLDRIGIFSEVPYISIGDKYNDKNNDAFLSYRTKGKQFITNPPKKGHDTRDVFFDKEFIRVFENEPYIDLVKLRRRWRLQAKEKNIVPAPFRPSNIPPKPSGSGSPWGTFEQQWPLEKNESEDRPSFTSEREPPEREALVNFLTRPPKKGGFGYANVTIGKQYEYIGDPYDGPDIVSRKDRQEHQRKVVGERPFISSSSKLQYFSPFVSLFQAQAGAKARSSKGLKKSSKLPVIQTPFKPSSGVGSTINKYPSYEPPQAPKGKKGKGGEEETVVLKGAAAKAPKVNLIFRPGGIPKSYPVRSIIDSNTPLAPPPWIQEALVSANVTVGGSQG